MRPHLFSQFVSVMGGARSNVESSTRKESNKTPIKNVIEFGHFLPPNEINRFCIQLQLGNLTIGEISNELYTTPDNFVTNLRTTFKESDDI